MFLLLPIPCRLRSLDVPSVFRQLITVLLVVLPLTACSSRRASVSGRVVDLNGKPIATAQIRFGDHRILTGANGRFHLTVIEQPGWIEVSRAGYLAALRPVQPGLATVVRLSPADGQTVVLRAVGDVMAGRRFFSGDPDVHQMPQLMPDAGVLAHQRLLQAVQPLLTRADLSLVNLESPLLPDPVAESQGIRAPGFHPTKPVVFASSLSLASALRQVGVDVVGLANNHVDDALERGLRTTLETLHLSGFHHGAGVSGLVPQRSRLGVLRNGGAMVASSRCWAVPRFLAVNIRSATSPPRLSEKGVQLFAKLIDFVQPYRRPGALVLWWW